MAHHVGHGVRHGQDEIGLLDILGRLKLQRFEDTGQRLRIALIGLTSISAQIIAFPLPDPLALCRDRKQRFFNFAVLMGALLCLPQIGEHPSWLLFYHLSYLHAKSRVIHLKKTKRNARFTEKLQILGKWIHKFRSRCKYPRHKLIYLHRP